MDEYGRVLITGQFYGGEDGTPALKVPINLKPQSTSQIVKFGPGEAYIQTLEVEDDERTIRVWSSPVA